MTLVFVVVEKSIKSVVYDTQSYEKDFKYDKRNDINYIHIFYFIFCFDNIIIFNNINVHSIYYRGYIKMDLQEVLNKLEEAIEEKNWDSVQEVYEQLIELNLDNPFDDYNGEDWG